VFFRLPELADIAGFAVVLDVLIDIIPEIFSLNPFQYPLDSKIASQWIIIKNLENRLLRALLCWNEQSSLME